MKYELAESILKSTMNHWDILKMADETKNIQIVSEIKYDDYQQFTHGMRYVESLALWMRQFSTKEEKECPYNFVKQQLIYISEEELRQLVSYSYPTVMKRYLIRKTKEFCERFCIYDTEERKTIYTYFRRSSLFLGLSDGAHIDYFRRQNPALNNEQVFVHYDFSDPKADDMKKELDNDPQIIALTGKYADELPKGFSSFFLIDDFTGSGISYIRKDSEGWHGKIPKFFDRLKATEFGSDDAEIHIVLYLATPKALDYITNQLKNYQIEEKVNSITLDSLQKIYPIDWQNNAELRKQLEANYKKNKASSGVSFEDKHFIKGGGKYPYFGFADCSLPLILFHNTPNNSLPILWYSWNDTVNALFPRVTRHKEN